MREPAPTAVKLPTQPSYPGRLLARKASSVDLKVLTPTAVTRGALSPPSRE